VFIAEGDKEGREGTGKEGKVGGKWKDGEVPEEGRRSVPSVRNPA